MGKKHPGPKYKLDLKYFVNERIGINKKNI